MWRKSAASHLIILRGCWRHCMAKHKSTRTKRVNCGEAEVMDTGRAFVLVLVRVCVRVFVNVPVFVLHIAKQNFKMFSSCVGLYGFTESEVWAVCDVIQLQ